MHTFDRTDSPIRQVRRQHRRITNAVKTVDLSSDLSMDDYDVLLADLPPNLMPSECTNAMRELLREPM